MKVLESQERELYFCHKITVKTKGDDSSFKGKLNVCCNYFSFKILYSVQIFRESFNCYLR